jgi:hypothetical protein
MRKVAEWILSPVTNSDRAASTNGDLREEAETPRECWVAGAAFTRT